MYIISVIAAVYGARHKVFPHVTILVCHFHHRERILKYVKKIPGK